MSSRWTSGRAVALHATTLAVIAACLALGWWQLERALSGNTLSWVYTFEWPFFAAYAVFMWWRLLHEEPGSGRRSTRRNPPSFEQSEDEDERLAEYNRYLADLRASDEPRHS